MPPVAAPDVDSASVPDRTLSLTKASTLTSTRALPSSADDLPHDKHEMHPARVSFDMPDTHVRPTLHPAAPDEHTRSRKAAKRKMPSHSSYSTEGGPSKKRAKQQNNIPNVRVHPAPRPAAVQADGHVDDDVRNRVHQRQRQHQREQKQQQQALELQQPEPRESHYREPNETIAHLVKQLRDACDEVASLQWSLKQAEADCDARHMRVRQDMLFDILLQQQKAAKALQSERNRWSRITASTKSELETKMKDLQATMEYMKREHETDRRNIKQEVMRLSASLNNQRSMMSRNLSDIAQLESELEHCKSLLRVADEDLAELQRLDNEERAIREKRNRGLPPAYGSLDDLEDLPPHGRHEDSGEMEVATIKHTARDRFTRDLSRAQNASDQLREAPSAAARNSAGEELYHLATTALAEACWSMGAILNAAKDAQAPERKKQKRSEDSDLDEPQRSHVSKYTFIANRVAKLIIDFCWQILACFDVRNLEVKLSPRVKAECGKYMRAADDMLLKALEVAILSGKEREDDALPVFAHEEDPCMRCHNPNCAGHCERMNELQYFLTILKSISHRFDRLTAKDMTSPSVTDTYNWLTENVETERRLAANARLPPTRQMSPADEEALAATAAAAVTAGRSICPQLNGPEIIADVQARLRRWQEDTTATPQTRTSDQAMAQNGRDTATAPSYHIMATITDTERGTTVSGVMVHNRDQNSEAEGDMFDGELGMLNEAEHVVFGQGLSHN